MKYVVDHTSRSTAASYSTLLAVRRIVSLLNNRLCNRWNKRENLSETAPVRIHAVLMDSILTYKMYILTTL